MKIQREYREKIVFDTERAIQYMYRNFDEKLDSFEANAAFNVTIDASSKDIDDLFYCKPIVDDTLVHNLSNFEQSTIIHPDYNLKISAMLFHPYYDMLIVSDGPKVGIW